VSARPVSPTEIENRIFLYSGFTANAIQKGSAYQREGRACLSNDRAGEGERAFEARVRGSGWQSYQLKIRVSRIGEDALSIHGRCSCPVGINCKHAVAAVLQWRHEAKPEALAVPAFSQPTARWIAELGEDVRRADEASAELRKRLYYLVSPDSDGGLGVQAVTRDLDSRGEPKGAAKAYDLGNATSGIIAQFLRASDLAIMPRLLRSSHGYPNKRYRLFGRDGASLLGELVESGRAQWLSIDGPVLRPAAPRSGSSAWRMGENGAQRFGFDLADGSQAVAVALDPPHYVDPETGETGLLETHLPHRLAWRLLSAPPVPPEEAKAMAEALASLLPASRLPLPAQVGESVAVRPEPVPVARLTMKALPSQGYGYWHAPSGYRAGLEVPAITFAFDYVGLRFDPDDPTPVGTRYDGDRILRIHRDFAAERRHLKRVATLGFTSFPSGWSHVREEKTCTTLWRAGALAPEDYVEFLLDVRPKLEAEGWQIAVDPEFPLRLLDGDDHPLDLQLDESPAEASGIDWFDLSLGVSVDGERIDLLPGLSMLLARLPAGREQAALAELATDGNGDGSRLLVALADGRTLPLPMSRIAPILEALVAVWGPAELKQGARLHPAQARDLADLESALTSHATFRGGERLKALAGELAGFRDRPPTALPAWFAARLRPYQQLGVDWLQMLARAGFGGVLADDMGLGKTVQLLAHLAVEKEAGRLERPALVVAPTSVLANWRAEAERFAPDLSVLVHQGTDRAKARLDTDGIDLVVTSYPLLARDRALLLGRRWSLAVLDEAQMIRNPKAATALAAFELEAGQRLALSGTPVENHLGDAWSLMRFLNPGLLGDAASFRTLYRTPIESRNDAGARARLSRRLAPFLLRRTKAEVAADLPSKSEIRETVTLTPAQRQLYDATRLIMQKKVRDALDQRGLARSAIVVLDALLKLRQACCDPRLVKSASATARAGGSAKLSRLLELVESLKAEGRSALVFSQFTSMLDLIRAEFAARDWRHAWLTGDTRDRKTPVDSFQSGDVDLFLISLKAGGVGLNLTQADTVILYDPWWNPAVEAQAIDRAHRIGQSQPVFVHRLIAADSVEEKMLELQARKKGFAEALWAGEAGGFAGLSNADVEALFE
jgi:superfamily II DNA or RNA helicase